MNKADAILMPTTYGYLELGSQLKVKFHYSILLPALKMFYA